MALALMGTLAGSLSIVVGTAVRTKLIIAARTADTGAARQTLEWMAERLQNAGFNLKPAEQAVDRCKDMVVAQDAALRPSATSLYVSGEFLNTDATAGNEVITLGYLLGSDPVSGKQVVMEDRRPCPDGTATLAPLSDPRIPVTELRFDYFSNAGTRITALTDTAQIRLIRLIRISLTLQRLQTVPGPLTTTWTRDVMLRNPEPNANDWRNPNEEY